MQSQLHPHSLLYSRVDSLPPPGGRLLQSRKQPDAAQSPDCAASSVLLVDLLDGHHLISGLLHGGTDGVV